MRCFLQATSLFLLIFIRLAKSSSSLYSDTDPLWILNSSNFNDIVLGKENAWIIQFYNSWCGHCIRFAPTWKEFAAETSTWRKVIDVGVINCVDVKNVQICRQYDVTSFPTLKLFWHHTNESDLGEVLTSDREIPSIEHKIFDFLESNWLKGVPQEWPSLLPVQMQSLATITQSMPESRASIMLLVEQPGSYIGRQVILDVSNQTNIIIKRVLTTNNGLLSDLNLQVANDTIPALIKIYRNKLQMPIFKFSIDHNSTYIRDQIFKNLTGLPRKQIKEEGKQPETSTSISVVNAVYMADLENAVYSVLTQEIGITKNIGGEKLSALKAFLSVLKAYFPGAPNVMEYLANLYNWVSYKKHSIAGEEFVQAMEQIKTETGYLPKMQEWVGCRGSETKYRGFPCSLWTLFHTLTVSTANAHRAQENEANELSAEVLFIIRDYVQHFFTCRECSNHFLQMAQNVEEEVKTSQDAVLWLWKAHNVVNKRLAGDITEDPKHPKIQFPSVVHCPNCHTESENGEDVSWQISEVYQYLLSFYHKQNILGHDNARVQIPLSVDKNQNNAAMGGSKLISNLQQILLCYLFITFINFWMYFGTFRHGGGLCMI